MVVRLKDFRQMEKIGELRKIRDRTAEGMTTEAQLYQDSESRHWLVDEKGRDYCLTYTHGDEITGEWKKMEVK